MSDVGHAVRLSVLVYGNNLDPDHLTSILGQKPDRAMRRGVTTVTSSGLEVIHKRGHWGIQSSLIEVNVDTKISKLLELPFAELLPRLDALRTNAKMFGVKISNCPDVEVAYADYYIYKNSERIHVPCEFECPLLQMIYFSELGLPLRYSVSIGSA